MSFNTFCNICFVKENIIKLCVEENESILNILISFASCPDILNGIIYLCINCYNKLEEYDKFRELYLTNFVRFRYLYNEHKKQLEIRNAPDIEKQLKTFVNINVERPSDTPLIENYEAAEALRNDTRYNLDICKKSDDEFVKLDLDEVVNKKYSSHADVPFSLENNASESEIQTCYVVYENDCSNEHKENIHGSNVGKSEPTSFDEAYNELTNTDFVATSTCFSPTFQESSNVLVKQELFEVEDTYLQTGEPASFDEKYNEFSNTDTVVTSISSFPSTVNESSNVLVKQEFFKIEDTYLGKEEPNPDRFEQLHDPLASDTIANVIPRHKSEDAGIFDVSIYPENCDADDKKDAKGHIDKENKATKSYTVCNVCDENYSWKSDLEVRMLTDTGEKLYNCDECNITFKNNYFLNEHKRIHTVGRPYKCDECGFAFIKKNHLRRHKCVQTGEKQYKCDECGLEFARTDLLNLHKVKHTGEKPHKCDECGFRYTRLADLKRHKRTHTGERPFSCDECHKTFAYNSYLIIHKRLHSGEKPYTCDECGLQFTQLSHLYTHKQKHSEKKLFSCDECHKTFTQISNLNKHKRIHSGVKPYMCDECGLGFSQLFNLNIHKLKHTGEKPCKCDECGLAFRKSNDLKRHKRLHTGEKEYKCDECGLGFARRDLLNIHKLKHTGEKPYKCDECGLGYLQRCTLNRHKRTHTKNSHMSQL